MERLRTRPSGGSRRESHGVQPHPPGIGVLLQYLHGERGSARPASARGMRPGDRAGGISLELMPRLIAASLLLACSTGLWAQSTAAQPSTRTTTDSAPASELLSPQARATYEFMLARRDQILAEVYGQAGHVDQALEEYRRAMHADPGSAYLGDQMAALLFRNGRTGDAIRLARSIVREHPQSIGAHELLGHLYLHLLGNNNDNSSSQMLNLALKEYQTLVTLDGESVENHLILGRLYRVAGQPQKAENEFQSSLKISPNSDEAISNLVYLYAEQGNLGEARKLVQSIPEDARTAAMYASLGFAYEHQRQFGEAAKVYGQAVALEPDNTDYRRGLAQTLLSNGQLSPALEQFKAIAQQEPDDAQSILQIAQIQRRMGLFADAERSLKRASKLLPNNIEIAYRFAELYEAEGKNEQAAQQLRGVLQQTQHANGKYSAAESDSRGALLEQLGLIERRDGNYPAALSAFEEEAKLGGDNQARGLMQQSETWQQQHDYKHALEVAAAAVQQLPGNLGLRLSYATLLADNGQTDDSLRQIRTLLTGDTRDRQIYLLMGQIDERARRWPAADENARKAESLAANNKEKAEAEFLLGSNQERQKKYAAAEAHFKQALQLDPGNAMVLNYLGYMLADRGIRLPEALSYVQQAVQRESNNGAYLDSLGWVYFKMDRLPEAMQNLQRAATLKQDDPVVLDHLAEVYFRTGKLRQAEDTWKRALNDWEHSAAADYDPVEVAKVQKKLDALRVRLARSGEAEKQ